MPNEDASAASGFQGAQGAQHLLEQQYGEVLRLAGPIAGGFSHQCTVLKSSLACIVMNAC